MRYFILGFVAAIAVIAGGAYAYFYFGMAPVAADSAPLPFEKLLTRMALGARVRKEAPKSAPIPASDEAYTAGAAIYQMHCAVCHGLPGQESTAIARGEFPKPPQLFTGMGVSDDPVGETYWKVANGIRLTGMPGFAATLSSTQMWQVSLLLANSDKLPAAVLNELRQSRPQQKDQ
jgi:mono/diheme cytochrome c family protein